MSKSSFRYCYYLPIFIFIILVVYLLLFLGYLLFLDINQFTFFLKALAKYDLNTIILGIVTIIIAILALCVELRKRYREKVENQIKLIGGLIAEIDILSAERSEIFNGGESPKGNLIWYQKAILSKNIMVLDHPVPNIWLDKYITGFDKSILKTLDTSKLSRTLSYLNNKCNEINYIQKIRDKTLNEITTALETFKKLNKEEQEKKLLDLGVLKKEIPATLEDKIKLIRESTIGKNIELYKELRILDSIYSIIEESITICHNTREELIKQHAGLKFLIN